MAPSHTYTPNYGGLGGSYNPDFYTPEQIVQMAAQQQKHRTELARLNAGAMGKNTRKEYTRYQKNFIDWVCSEESGFGGDVTVDAAKMAAFLQHEHTQHVKRGNRNPYGSIVQIKAALTNMWNLQTIQGHNSNPHPGLDIHVKCKQPAERIYH
ncbi:hypothetical protein A1Q2_08470 [Trichosporon asahii var. asahii CBS 8904]|uniref:Uncharacterized protein n=1 Tax=Trichosporon asahii var. asahii (strain CBS 8904) TaxID=1220162 RepID=K1VDY0_TRIAC|nr:hypothetical protein A1Q2_08470 [Trichosporon asahii var. asahii CBS 8904]